MKKFICLSLSIIMVLSSAATMIVFANDETNNTKKNYVYVGDSTSFNFASGRHDYSTNLKKIYPQIIAQKLNLNLTDNQEPDGTVPTRGGLRTTDFYAYLADDGFVGDACTVRQYDGIDQERKTAAYNYIKNADIITVQLGYSNLTSYTLQNIVGELGLVKEYRYGNDLSKYYSMSDIARQKEIAQKSSENIFSAKIFKNSMVGVLLNSIGLDINLFKDTLTFAMASHMYDFDRMIKRMREINPNAEIYVVGLYNSMPNLQIKNLLGNNLDLKAFIQPYFDTVNNYMKNTSTCKGEYVYIEPPKNMEVFANLMSKDAATTEEIYTKMTGDKAFAKELTPTMMKVLQTKTIDATNIISDFMASQDALNALLGQNINDYNSVLKSVSSWIGLDKNGKLKANEFQKALLYVFNLYMQKALGVHPTQNGHTNEGNYLVSEIMAARNPVTTTVSKATGARKSLTAKWKKKSKVDGYQIQASTSSKFTNSKTAIVKGASKTSGKVKSLKSGKKYYVRVRTYKIIDGAKNYSKWSKVKTAKAK